MRLYNKRVGPKGCKKCANQVQAIATICTVSKASVKILPDFREIIVYLQLLSRESG